MLTARRPPGSQLAGEVAARRCKAYLTQRQAHAGKAGGVSASGRAVEKEQKKTSH